jgi:hypothetical protein
MAHAAISYARKEVGMFLLVSILLLCLLVAGRFGWLRDRISRWWRELEEALPTPWLDPRVTAEARAAARARHPSAIARRRPAMPATLEPAESPQRPQVDLVGRVEAAAAAALIAGNLARPDYRRAMAALAHMDDVTHPIVPPGP